MDNKKKLIILIVSIITLILLIIGGTYAYWSWSSDANQQTEVTFTVTPNLTCSADAGGHITSNDRMLAPTDCMDPEYAIQRTITTSVTTGDDKVASMNLWLNVNHVDTNLLNSSYFKYAITKNKNSCTSGIINSGVIGTDITNNKIDLLNGAEYATLDDTYYLYIWLDELEDDPNTMNQSFDFSIGGECIDNNLEKTTMVSLNSTNYFRESAYKTKITDIYFIYDEDLPSGITEDYVKTYNLGTSAAKPITGYLITNTDEGAAEDTYKLYVSSEYKIYTGVLIGAFNGMTALKSITFDNFDTSATTDMSGMFTGCSSLTSLDLSNFNTSNVTNMGTRLAGMFEGCTALTQLNISSFDTSKVTSMISMFARCSSLTSLDVSSFNTSSLVSVSANSAGNRYGMFYGCSSLTELDITNFDTSHITNMEGMFQNCSGLTSLDLSHFSTASATSMLSMFQGCSSLTSLDLSNFNTANVGNMSAMFSGCSRLINLDLSSFSTSSVGDMSNMFYNCSSLTSLDLSNFNTSSVTNMSSMFRGTSGLKTLDLTSFNTLIVTKMDYMFNGCGAESLDLSSFNTTALNGTYLMFSTSKLKTVYVSNSWNTDSVTDSRRMFEGCSAIVGGNGTKYNGSYQDKTYARIDNPPDSPGYFTYKAHS